MEMDETSKVNGHGTHGVCEIMLGLLKTMWANDGLTSDRQGC